MLISWPIGACHICVSTTTSSAGHRQNHWKHCIRRIKIIWRSIVGRLFGIWKTMTTISDAWTRCEMTANRIDIWAMTPPTVACVSLAVSVSRIRSILNWPPNEVKMKRHFLLLYFFFFFWFQNTSYKKTMRQKSFLLADRWEEATTHGRHEKNSLCTKQSYIEPKQSELNEFNWNRTGSRSLTFGQHGIRVKRLQNIVELLPFNSIFSSYFQII